MNASLIESASGFYQDEINDFLTYETLARHEGDPRLREAIHRIAGMEQRHSRFWKEFVEKRGGQVPDPTENRLRLAALRLLQRVVNPVLIVSALELGEMGAFKRYHAFYRDVSLEDEERAMLRQVILEELDHERFFKKESRELGVANVRDFVLGMNDGLVELLGAVTGLSAVYVGNPLIVGVSGVVVGIAGALSMGIGAFVSVRSQRQVNEGRQQRMEVLFDVAPERAVGDYREQLLEAGVSEERAESVAHVLREDRDAITRLMLEEAGENEMRSGLFTGFAYLFGVVFPVLPYFVADNSWVALAASVALAGLALAVVGGLISLISGIALRRKLLEMVTLGLGAAAVSYAVGSAVQALFGIQV